MVNILRANKIKIKTLMFALGQEVEVCSCRVMFAAKIDQNRPFIHWCLPILRNPISLILGLGLGLRLGLGIGLGLGLGLHHALRHDALRTSVSNNFVHIRRIGIRQNGAEPIH